jgi:DNA-binding response OmpR family regulator
MRYYISIETNTEVFDLYKELWSQHGVVGIRADSMTEGIEKAIEIECSKLDELYFIDIVADDVDYMAQLSILSAETNAPILIVTTAPNDAEHHEALENGADFYGGYCEMSEENIKGVMLLVKSMDRRATKPKKPSQIMFYKDMLIAPVQRSVFASGIYVDLTRRDFDILHYLVKNQGQALSYNKIYKQVWGCEYDGSKHDTLWSAIKRLRKKLKVKPDSLDYIETLHDYGYKVSLEKRKRQINQ